MLIYMAHPVSAKHPDLVEANVASAEGWLKFCHEHLPAWTVIAPWIVEVRLYDDADPVQRAAGLKRDLDVVRRCDGALLVGPTVTAGMRLEAQEACRNGKSVYRLRSMEVDGEDPVWPTKLHTFGYGQFPGDIA